MEQQLLAGEMVNSDVILDNEQVIVVLRAGNFLVLPRWPFALSPRSRAFHSSFSHVISGAHSASEKGYGSTNYFDDNSRQYADHNRDELDDPKFHCLRVIVKHPVRVIGGIQLCIPHCR